MSGRCLEVVWKAGNAKRVAGECLKVSGGCLNVIGRCLQDVWNVFGFFGSQKVGKGVSTGRCVSGWCLEGVWMSMEFVLMMSQHNNGVWSV